MDKRIPAGAGLGGGSSDAAATLVGLENLLHGGLGRPELAEIGARIGSDVPFFLGSAAAIVSGRGELLDPLEARRDFSFLLVEPGFSVPTAGAYALLDRERPDDADEPDPDPAAIASAYRGGIRAWPFGNSFGPVLEAERPELGSIRRLLLDSGAAFAAMSGSGSTMFGVFEDEFSLRAGVEAVGAAGFRAHVASPLARIPYLD